MCSRRDLPQIPWLIHHHCRRLGTHTWGTHTWGRSSLQECHLQENDVEEEKKSCRWHHCRNSGEGERESDWVDVCLWHWVVLELKWWLGQDYSCFLYREAAIAVRDIGGKNLTLGLSIGQATGPMCLWVHNKWATQFLVKRLCCFQYITLYPEQCRSQPQIHMQGIQKRRETSAIFQLCFKQCPWWLLYAEIECHVVSVKSCVVPAPPPL